MKYRVISSETIWYEQEIEADSFDDAVSKWENGNPEGELSYLEDEDGHWLFWD